MQMNNINTFLILFILISCSLCEFKRIYNLTENEFIEVSKGTINSTIRWLMIFYTKQYHSYNQFKELINMHIYPRYEKDITIKFGLIDCHSKSLNWLVNILKIKSIPYMIFIENGRMYYYGNEVISKENIINFIDKQKLIYDSYPIIDKINFVTKVKFIFNMSIDILNSFFQKILNKLNINYKWSNKLSILFIGLIIFIFFIIEIKIFQLICMKTGIQKEVEDFIYDKNYVQKITKKNKNKKKKD